MRYIVISFLSIALLFSGCTSKQHQTTSNALPETTAQYISVLGVAQDAGFPQIACTKTCCQAFYNGEASKKLVSSLGLVDRENNQKWLFDATPDMTQQLHNLKQELDNGKVVDGVFLTHAHIGHYTGLMFFGFEAMSAVEVPVYAMPEMRSYLETNGPWSQLVAMKNIKLQTLKNDSVLVLNKALKVTPFLVPHRDEYSETVGYRIEGPQGSALFIPDINKWDLWDRDIIEEVRKVDYAFIDATFFKDGEVPRPMKDIPHPFIIETVKLFENESRETKAKIHFIHLNHTNPALHNMHPLKDSIQGLGFRFAKQGQQYPL